MKESYKKRLLLTALFIGLVVIFLKFHDPSGLFSDVTRKAISCIPELLLIVVAWIGLNKIKPAIDNTILLLVTLILLYCSDFVVYKYNNYYSKEARLVRAAVEKGVQRDNRKLFEYLEDATNNEVPALSPANWLQDLKLSVYPLSGISKSKTVYCVEEIDWVSYNSDRYGFRNSDLNWSKFNEWILLGDSFTQGGCVKSEENISGNLSRLGVSNINMGWGGTSIALQSAIYREYSVKADAKVVALFAYPRNDYVEIAAEIRNPIIRRYLESPSYSQNLVSRVSALDEFLQKKVNLIKSAGKSFYKFYQLPGFGGMIANWYKSRQWNDNADLYAVHLGQLKNNILEDGRKLIVICVPSYQDLAESSNRSSCDDLRKRVSGIGIDFIDVTINMKKEANYKRYFPYGEDAHFNEFGYKIFSEKVFHAYRKLINDSK